MKNKMKNRQGKSMDYDAFAPFGELLKAFRQRSMMTQQQLAVKLGVHRNTLGSWERGDFLPESRGMVLELAKHLSLGDQETRFFLEASLISLAPHWLVPFQRNRFFTGRKEILEILHRRLHADQIVALAQSYALHGLGGIGKTQIALEYAYRHALEYSAVFWIDAETVESITASMVHIADILHLPERAETDQQRIVTAVQRWLTTHKAWLLIWDNLEEPELLQRFLPSIRLGAILITTRCQALGTLVERLGLQPLKPEEGIVFLLRRATLLGPEATSEHVQQFAHHQTHEYAAAEELVRAMGGLPLALDQAGAYIDETGCSVSDYLQHYEKLGPLFLDRRGTPGRDHPASVATTFSLAYTQVKQKNPVAASVLCLSVFLSPDTIPEELFTASAPGREPAQEPVVADFYHMDQAFAVLRAFSLVQRNLETRTFSLHRLVQAVLRVHMNEHERTAFQQRAIILLNTLFPEVAHRAWEQCERLLPHVLTSTAALSDQGALPDLADVLRKAADYLCERAQYEEAEPLFQRALHLLEQTREPEHLEMAAPLYSLSVLYLRQRKYEEAEPLFQRVLRIREQVLGPDHPDLAPPFYSLATLYLRQGKYEQAETLFLQSLRIREQVLGPDHPDLASPLYGLANLFVTLGKYEQAERLYQQALAIREQALGPEHSDLAPLLYALAHLHCEQGKYEQVEPDHQRALRIWEQTLGPDHPNVAYPLSGLATLYLKQGKYEQVEPLYLRALQIWEQALGPENSQVAYPLNNLADFYCTRGKYERAELFYQRALLIWKQTLGSTHREVAYPLHGLATLSLELGRDEEAERLYQQALIIREQSLGPCHSETASSLLGLARLYEKQGKDEQAEQFYQRACLVFEQSLGQAHPETMQARDRYRSFLERKKK